MSDAQAPPALEISFFGACGDIYDQMPTGSVEYESIVPCIRIVLA